MAKKTEMDADEYRIYEYLADELSTLLYEANEVSISEVAKAWHNMRKQAEEEVDDDDDERFKFITAEGLSKVLAIMEENGGDFVEVVRAAIEEGTFPDDYDEEDD